MTIDEKAALASPDTSVRAADRIRDFAYDAVLRSKFDAGATEVRVRAGDIHSALKLRNQMPNVCSALESRKFAEKHGLVLTRREGPHRGSNAVYFFERQDPRGIRSPSTTTPTPVASHDVSTPSFLESKPAARTVYWISCVSQKRSFAAPARDLYISDWFAKARAHVETTGAPWWILSAKYGLVSPTDVVEPYELTLNTLPVAERRRWAGRVQQQLESMGALPKKVVMLAGARYREFVEPYLKERGVDVEVPMEGLRIGEQLAWLSRKRPTSRLDALRRFYSLLDQLEHRQGGKRTLAACDGRVPWPRRGVYFFFENGETRSDSGTGPRVVRVGTHALKAGSNTELWGRLSQHRGSAQSGGGNHRGSIFRLLVGDAIKLRDGAVAPQSWGVASDTATAALRLGMDEGSVARGEDALERSVSVSIGCMPFLCLEIDDEPGPNSLRATIERNAIALLSNFDRAALDPPSLNWLGRHSSRDRVRGSGLWNNRHVEESFDPSFLDSLEQQLASASARIAKRHEMSAISPSEAVGLAVRQIAATIEGRIREDEDANVRDGWPDGLINYVGEREDVWTVSIPSERPTTGASRVICVSKTTGRILFDGYVGE